MRMQVRAHPLMPAVVWSRSLAEPALQQLSLPNCMDGHVLSNCYTTGGIDTIQRHGSGHRGGHQAAPGHGTRTCWLVLSLQAGLRARQAPAARCSMCALAGYKPTLRRGSQMLRDAQ